MSSYGAFVLGGRSASHQSRNNHPPAIFRPANPQHSNSVWVLPKGRPHDNPIASNNPINGTSEQNIQREPLRVTVPIETNIDTATTNGKRKQRSNFQWRLDLCRIYMGGETDESPALNDKTSTATTAKTIDRHDKVTPKQANKKRRHAEAVAPIQEEDKKDEGIGELSQLGQECAGLY